MIFVIGMPINSGQVILVKGNKTMSDIQRYGYGVSEGGVRYHYQAEDGKWCKYEDHKAAMDNRSARHDHTTTEMLKETNAALDEIERLRAENKTLSDINNVCLGRLQEQEESFVQDVAEGLSKKGIIIDSEWADDMATPTEMLVYEIEKIIAGDAG